MIKKSKITAAMIVAFVAVVSLSTQTALAATNDNNTRPGWGFGDRHHHHVGPPGQSHRPSDRFGDGDNDRDDQGHRETFHISFGNHNIFYGLENFFHNFFG